MAVSLPSTLGALRQAVAAGKIPRRPVRSELRDNLIVRMRSGGPLFPGIIGYDDTVVPQVVNAILSRHHFILLGLRGQAKTRLLRALTTLLDEHIPVIAGLARSTTTRWRRSAAYGRRRVAEAGDDLPIAWLPPRRALRREARHAGRDDRRHDRRHRSDQGGAQRPRARRRADDALRPAAARQPRHLRHQRAARPRRPHPGRPVQHPPGGRRPDQGLPGAAAARRADGLHRQPRGLHGARQDHHAAQGPHRLGDPHPLPGHAGRRRWPSPSRRRGRSAAGCRCTMPALRPRGGRGSRLPGAQQQQDRQALGRQPAPADQRARERHLERRAARAGAGRVAGGAARGRRLRRPPGDHRQVRAGVRGRAEGRRRGRPRPDPLGGAERRHRLLPRRRRARRGALVRWRRLAAALRHDRRARSGRSHPRGRGPARGGAPGQRQRRRRASRSWPPPSTSRSRRCAPRRRSAAATTGATAPARTAAAGGSRAASASGRRARSRSTTTSSSTCRARRSTTTE